MAGQGGGQSYPAGMTVISGELGQQPHSYHTHSTQCDPSHAHSLEPVPDEPYTAVVPCTAYLHMRGHTVLGR
jgi:hypothetical protein